MRKTISNKTMPQNKIFFPLIWKVKPTIIPNIHEMNIIRFLRKLLFFDKAKIKIGRIYLLGQKKI